MNTSLLTELKSGITTNSPEETNTFAKILAEALPENSTLALRGDLGAGKTTLVKALAASWGITETVSSPTYNIVLSYTGRTRNLVHMDAYRLEDASQFDELMLEDFIQAPWCLAVEWPESVIDRLPDPIYRLDLEPISENSRRFTLMD